MIQLCWNCKKCTNMNLCKWVNGELPDGVTLKNGYIVACKDFEQDKFLVEPETKLKKEIMQKLKISERSFYRFKLAYKSKQQINSKKYKEFVKFYEVHKNEL